MRSSVRLLRRHQSTRRSPCRRQGAASRAREDARAKVRVVARAYALGEGAQRYWELYGTARCIFVLRYLWVQWNHIRCASCRAAMCTSGQSALARIFVVTGTDEFADRLWNSSVLPKHARTPVFPASVGTWTRYQRE